MTSQDQIKLRWTEPHEKNLFAYSHSIVEGILTCPVWGIIRYVKNKYYPITNRFLALEAGGAMHEIFAAVRLWQLYRIQNLKEHFVYNGIRLFGKERFNKSFEEIPDNKRDELINFCYNILNTGEYFDDPSDTIRTLANMEVTIIRYCDDRLAKMSSQPIWIDDIADPTSLVGIEQVFDMMVEFNGQSLRYIGTVDGITLTADHSEVIIDENKTASRLDNTWRVSWAVKSQPVGYMLATRLMSQLPCNQVRIIGCKVKQTRSVEDMLTFLEPKSDEQVIDWVRSLFFAHNIAEQHKDNPLHAPQFTHSCSRYFRPCAFIDLCGAEHEDRKLIYESLVDANPTPSQQAIEEGRQVDAASRKT